MDESGRCFEGRAFFGASVMGCAAFEAILILACIRERNRVVQTESWKKFAKKQKRHGQLFGDILFWIDLGVLTSIGYELGWFPADHVIPNLFATVDGWNAGVEMFPGLDCTTREAVNQMHELRNLLHPGRCIRENTRIDESTGHLSLGLLYLSLAGILDYHREDSRLVLEVRVSPSMLKAMANAPPIFPPDAIMTALNTSLPVTAALMTEETA